MDDIFNNKVIFKNTNKNEVKQPEIKFEIKSNSEPKSNFNIHDFFNED